VFIFCDIIGFQRFPVVAEATPEVIQT